jgi:hypothetical protein
MFKWGTGDCFRACLSSILELPLYEVPHFCLYDNQWWWKHCDDWLRPRGLTRIELDARTDGVADFLLEIPDYYVANGPSSRLSSTLHSVVGHKCKLVFDPIPGGRFLSGPPESFTLALPTDRIEWDKRKPAMNEIVQFRYYYQP